MCIVPPLGGKQECKVFIGGLSWETTGEKLRAYFENYGVVREAFVSYNRNNGRPRGFGFVVFESSEVADKVVATKHTIDRREVEAKRAVPKDEQQQSSSPPSSEGSVKTKKIFVGGLAPSVDEKIVGEYFEQFGTIEDTVVMYDHDNKRPRGFGFVTFISEESVDKVFGRGAMQTILEKQIEIKPAVPRDQMPAVPRAPNAFFDQQGQQQGGMPGGHRGGAYPYGPQPGLGAGHAPYGAYRGPGGGPAAGYGARAFVPSMQQHPQNLGPRGRGGFNGSLPVPPSSYHQGPRGYGLGAGGGKVGGGIQTGYDIYGAGNVFGSQALYNQLAAGFNPQHLNAAAGVNGKLNTFSNDINLKALGALASFGAFPNSQAEGTYQDDAGSYGPQDAVADYAAAEAAAVNQAAAGLAAAADFSYENGGFTTSPAPGWSS